MKNLTEIIFGDSTNCTMSRSQLGKNEIIKFNTVFSIANLSYINQFKIILPKDIYKEEIGYDFSEEMNKLDFSIKINLLAMILILTYERYVCLVKMKDCV